MLELGNANRICAMTIERTLVIAAVPYFDILWEINSRRARRGVHIRSAEPVWIEGCGNPSRQTPLHTKVSTSPQS